MDLSKFLRAYTRVNASQTCSEKLQQSQVVVWVFKNGRWTCTEQDGIPRIGESWCQFYLTTALGLNAEEYARAKKNLFEGSYPVGVYRHKSQTKFAIVYKPKRRYHKEIVAALVTAGGVAVGSQYLRSKKKSEPVDELASLVAATTKNLDDMYSEYQKRIEHGAIDFKEDADWRKYDTLRIKLQVFKHPEHKKYLDQQELMRTISKLKLSPPDIANQLKEFNARPNTFSTISKLMSESDLDSLQTYFEKIGDNEARNIAEVAKVFEPVYTHIEDHVTTDDPGDDTLSIGVQLCTPLNRLIEAVNVHPGKYQKAISELAEFVMSKPQLVQQVVGKQISSSPEMVRAFEKENLRKLETTRARLEAYHAKFQLDIDFGRIINEDEYKQYSDLFRAYNDELKKTQDIGTVHQLTNKFEKQLNTLRTLVRLKRGSIDIVTIVRDSSFSQLINSDIWPRNDTRLQIELRKLLNRIAGEERMYKVDVAGWFESAVNAYNKSELDQGRESIQSLIQCSKEKKFPELCMQALGELKQAYPNLSIT